MCRGERWVCLAAITMSPRAREARVPGVRRAGRMESAKQKLVCPFCGTESPHDRSRARESRRARSRAALRELPDGARLAEAAAQRAVPELQGGDGVRPGARRAELRVLRLAGAGRLPGDQVADSPEGRAAVQDRSRAACATTSAAGGAAAGSRRAGSPRRRSSTRCTASTFRTGPSTRRRTARGRRRPATTTTSACRAATARATASCAGAPRAMGARGRRRRSLLRR